MYSATANRARALVVKFGREYISFFRAAKNDWAAALSQHTPARPTLGRTSMATQNSRTHVRCIGRVLATAVTVRNRAGLLPSVIRGLRARPGTPVAARRYARSFQ